MTEFLSLLRESLCSSIRATTKETLLRTTKNLCLLHRAKILFFNKNLSCWLLFCNKTNPENWLHNFFSFYILFLTLTELKSDFFPLFFSPLALRFLFFFCSKTLTLKKLNLYWTCYFSLFGIVSFSFDVLRLLDVDLMLWQQSGVIVYEWWCFTSAA